jgi:8-oxo-dGTP pyrophosphatase MutT (NUDIX family)
MILRESPAGLEILLIERAPHDRDPWSGDLGFPGGKLEPGDLGLRQTAERETREELGLDLAEARFLGRLDDIPGAHLPVVVACFAFGLNNAPHLVPGEEIKSAFWVPLGDLFDPGRRLDARVHFNGQELTRPALQLPLPGRTILWGITFRMVTGLRERLEIP